MQPLSLDDPSTRRTNGGFALFALGFRPFFLLAGLGGTLLLAAWIWGFSHPAMLAGYYGPLVWHGHEMVYGFTPAVVAGFLLTAIRNWTGVPTLRGLPLALLAGLWLAGRLLPWIPGIPGGVIALVDFAFLPLLALAAAWPLVRARHHKSLMFIAILLGLAAGNGLVHGDRLGWFQGTAQGGLYLGVYLLVLLMVIMGGRVIPFFTEKALPGVQPRRHGWVEWVAPWSILALALLQLVTLPPVVTGLLALLAAVANGVRLGGWYSKRIWRVPILWVLHLGYAWLVLGLLLVAGTAFGLGNAFSALHALTVGGLGLITLGMMTRVALGHTGRMMKAPPPIPLAYGLLLLSALVRVFPPLFLDRYHVLWVNLAGGLWVLALGLFTWRYAPILIRPRVDGRPG